MAKRQIPDIPRYTGNDRVVGDIFEKLRRAIDVLLTEDFVTDKDIYCKDLIVSDNSIYLGKKLPKNKLNISSDDIVFNNLTLINEDNMSTFIAVQGHGSNHNDGGADPVNHDNLAGFEADEHIDWTATPTKNFSNNGTLKAGDGGTTNYLNIAADGELNLLGTARILKDVWLPFNGMRAPGTKPATFAEHGISGAWSFADGDDETIVFNIKFPNDMDKSVAPSITIGWSTTTAVTSETATWRLEYLYTQAGEDTSAAAQATITVDSNAIAQAEGLILATFPAMDIPHADDVCMHCRLKRLGAGDNDDLTDTAELHGVCMEYTSNKLGKAL